MGWSRAIGSLPLFLFFPTCCHLFPLAPTCPAAGWAEPAGRTLNWLCPVRFLQQARAKNKWEEAPLDLKVKTQQRVSKKEMDNGSERWEQGRPAALPGSSPMVTACCGTGVGVWLLPNSLLTHSLKTRRGSKNPLKWQVGTGPEGDGGGQTQGTQHAGLLLQEAPPSKQTFPLASWLDWAYEGPRFVPPQVKQGMSSASESPDSHCPICVYPSPVHMELNVPPGSLLSLLLSDHPQTICWPAVSAQKAGPKACWGYGTQKWLASTLFWGDCAQRLGTKSGKPYRMVSSFHPGEGLGQVPDLACGAMVSRDLV